MPPAVQESPRRRPDDSMSLLADIAGQALDPGYAVASARARGGDGAPARTRPSPLLAVGVLLAALLVVIAAVQAHVRAPAAAKTREDLVAAVRHQSAQVDALAHQVAALRQQTSQLRDRTLAGTTAGARLAPQVRAQEGAAGLTPVAGPGLRVTIDDSHESNNGTRIQDRDLQAVVNALWAAGAEAIAVNGQRLTAQSAIREAGEAILVDFQPLTAPYVVETIGDPQRLQASYGSSPASDRIGEYRRLFDVRVDVRRVPTLRLAAAAEESLHFAQPVRNGSGGHR